MIKPGLGLRHVELNHKAQVRKSPASVFKRHWIYCAVSRTHPLPTSFPVRPPDLCHNLDHCHPSPDLLPPFSHFSPCSLYDPRSHAALQPLASRHNLNHCHPPPFSQAASTSA